MLFCVTCFAADQIRSSFLGDLRSITFHQSTFCARVTRRALLFLESGSTHPSLVRAVQGCAFFIVAATTAQLSLTISPPAVEYDHLSTAITSPPGSRVSGNFENFPKKRRTEKSRKIKKPEIGKSEKLNFEIFLQLPIASKDAFLRITSTFTPFHRKTRHLST